MASGKILVVDDDQNICELLRLYIEKEGFEVVIANDGRKALEMFEQENPDLIMLDIMLPELDGWQVCREIRKKSQCPIIMLTAKGEVFDKVLGLELGADDYVVKPFEAKEVIARIKAVLRRFGKNDENQVKEVKYDKLSINLTNYELKVNGKVVDTPPKEMELIYHLASNPEPRLYARPAVGRGVGVRLLRRQPYGGRPCQAPARKAGGRLRPVGVENCLGRWLQI